MATLIASQHTDHSPLDGTNDAINGAEVDENPTATAQVLDGTSQIDLASDDRLDFLSAAAHTTSREAIRLINLDNAAAAVHDMMVLEWDPGDAANLTDNSSGMGIIWKMPDDGDVQTEFARLDVICVADTGGAEEGEFSFKVVTGGTESTEVMTIKNAGVGIGIADGDGTLHVHTSTAGTIVANAVADDLVVENTTNGGVTVLTGNTSDGYYAFGDDGNALAGAVRFDHNVDEMGFEFGGVRSVTMKTFGLLGIGVTAWGTSGTNVLGITADGVVPSTSPAGMIQIFADDSSGGATNATLAIRTEEAVASEVLACDSTLNIWVNGTEYHLLMRAV